MYGDWTNTAFVRISFGLKLLILSALLAISAALAGHEASLSRSDFEIDTNANLIVDENPTPSTGRPSLDWANVEQQRRPDRPSGQSDDSFGQGTKEDTPEPAIVSGSIPPNKSDLLEFGVYQETSTDGNFLHLYWTRVQDPSGTTNMDFEFNQSTTLSSNGVTPLRVAGDLLITYDLARGGTRPVLQLRSWNGTVWGPPMDLSSAAMATGSINTSPIASGASDGIGALSARTFGEASINLAIIFDPTQCQSFGSAYLKSRSSDSFSAALKDFIAPIAVNISNCGSIRINKRDDSGAALAGARFELFNDRLPLAADQSDPTQPGAGDDSTGRTCTTNAQGTCTFVNVLAGTYWVVETLTPPGHQTAPPQAVVIVADEQLALTFVNPRQPATVNIIKRDDAGANLAGAQFRLHEDRGVVGQYEPTTDPATAFSCTTAADGRCTIGNILPPGNYCVVESVTPPGHDTAPPQCVSLTLGASVTLTFIDPRRPARVNIIKRDDAGAALAGAGFGLFEDRGTTGVYEPGVDVATGRGCTTGAAGTCSIQNILPPGLYCVVETVTPPGHLTAAPQCLSLALDQTVTLTFVNERRAATINISKTGKSHAAGGSAPLAGATFTLFSDNGQLGVFENGIDLPTAFICTTGPGGTCAMQNVLPAGRYCLVETVVPPGYQGGAPQCFTVSLGQDLTLAFSNDPLSALRITFYSLAGEGVTVATSVICSGPGVSGELGPLGDGDDHLLTGLEEGTYTCTVVVDP